MASELHLFIIWQNARDKAREILEDMGTRFEIRRVLDVQWSDAHFSDNMSRFYGKKLPDRSEKERHCGRGPFLLVIVRDNSPQYGVRETSAGPREVNARLFDAKTRYRQLTGGGHRIHGTNTPAETDHDLVLLTQQTAAEFEASHTTPWDGRIEPRQMDLAGADGWPTLQDLLHTLNAAIDYAVLRNFERFPENATIDGHGDVDLLCANAQEMAFITNGRPVFKEPYRVLHHVLVGGAPMQFDFRAVGDNYYDPAWAQDMLGRRVLSPKGFYHLSADDHFYSLLYHAAVHKPSIAPDYVTRLIDLSRGIDELDRSAFADPQALQAVVDRFLSRHGYRFVEPADLSVYFNAPFARMRTISVNRILGSSRSIGAALQAVFEQAGDCSTASPEWEDPVFRSNYLAPHFSPARGMLIEALGLSPSSRVLEVGAASGVLTRFLGERFRRVTALEPDADLCKAVRARCRDLTSVDVQPVSLDKLDGGGHFDVAIVHADQRSLTAAVRHLSRRLTKNGVVLFGITGDSVTSLRDDAVEQLRAQGFTSFRFLFPFPSLALPRAVFADEAIDARLKAYGYWAAFAQADSQHAERLTALKAAAVGARGELDTLAQQCYIVASREPAAMPAFPWQVWSTSSPTRHPSFRATTEVRRHQDSLAVHKHGRPSASGVFRFAPESVYPLFEGHSAGAFLTHALVNGTAGEFMSLLNMHATSLTAEFAFQTDTTYPPLLVDGDVLLRGEALDAIPQNAVIERTRARFFDLEWQTGVPLPLSYVLFRGLFVLFQKTDTAAVCAKFRLEHAGLPPEPGAFALALFFVSALRLFGRLESRAAQHIAAFEVRFMNFASHGQVPADEASLFELYHQAIACHAEGRQEDLDDALAALTATYPNAPETRRLASSLGLGTSTHSPAAPRAPVGARVA